MTKLKRLLKSIIDDIAVYICTLIGVLVAQYGPLVADKGTIDMAMFQWIRLIISAAAALMIVARFELQGDQEAKKQKIRKRMLEAFSHGMMVEQTLGLMAKGIAA